MDIYDPYDIEQQREMMWIHPLMTKDYVALTPSMPKVLEIVIEHIMLHKRCLVFKAYPRMGKTTTCNFVISALKRHPALKDRFVTRVSADTINELKRREHIVKSLANALHHFVPKRLDTAALRQDVLNAIESALKNMGGRHWVLFIDELQTLTIEDFEHLQHIQNLLAINGIDTTLIGFSQTQINFAIELLKKQKRVELNARFLSEVLDLPCCDDHTWMEETVKGYDENFTYPPGSNCTYTQFFLPRAFEAGFRLATYAPQTFKVMSEVVTGAIRVIPTEFVFEVFRLILIRSMNSDSADFEMVDETIKSATAESGLRAYMDILKEGGVL